MKYNQTKKQRYRIIRLYHQLEKVDQDFYNPDDSELQLIDPVLTLEINANGTLEFTMPYTHKYFDSVYPMIDEFMVRDDISDETLFIGRPISCEVTDFKRVKVYCEGALGYLHDILIRPVAWEVTTPKDFFISLVSEYNIRKAPRVPHQELYIGECDIQDRDIYRYANYDKAYTLLERGCLESDGGYLMMTYGSDGKKTVNWYKNPESAVPGDVQAIAYAKNIVSFSEELDLGGAASFAIVLGAESETEELPGDQGKKRLELSEPVGLGAPAGDATWEYDWIIGRYGYVERLYEYDEPTTQADLKLAFLNDPAPKLEWPEKQITVDCEVVDMHFVDNDISKLKVGQRVNLEVPYKIYTQLADVLHVTKIRYELTSAVLDVTVGELPKRSLSDQFRKNSISEDADSKLKDYDRRIRDLERDYGSIGSVGGIEGDGMYMYIGDPVYVEGT